MGVVIFRTFNSFSSSSSHKLDLLDLSVCTFKALYGLHQCVVCTLVGHGRECHDGCYAVGNPDDYGCQMQCGSVVKGVYPGQ